MTGENIFIFHDWCIRPLRPMLAQQYDSKSQEIIFRGDIPEGFDWFLLIKFKELYNSVKMAEQDGELRYIFDNDDLSQHGQYQFQLKAVLKDDSQYVRHTNVASVGVYETITGSATWPEIPDSFLQLEQELIELSQHPAIPGDDGYYLIWDIDTHEYVKSEFPVSNMDYIALEHKPQINGVELDGNKTSADLSLLDADTFYDIDISPFIGPPSEEPIDVTEAVGGYDKFSSFFNGLASSFDAPIFRLGPYVLDIYNVTEGTLILGIPTPQTYAYRIDATMLMLQIDSDDQKVYGMMGDMETILGEQYNGDIDKLPSQYRSWLSPVFIQNSSYGGSVKAMLPPYNTSLLIRQDDLSNPDNVTNAFLGLDNFKILLRWFSHNADSIAQFSLPHLFDSITIYNPVVNDYSGETSIALKADGESITAMFLTDEQIVMRRFYISGNVVKMTENVIAELAWGARYGITSGIVRANEELSVCGIPLTIFVKQGYTNSLDSDADYYRFNVEHTLPGIYSALGRIDNGHDIEVELYYKEPEDSSHKLMVFGSCSVDYYWNYQASYYTIYTSSGDTLLKIYATDKVTIHPTRYLPDNATRVVRLDHITFGLPQISETVIPDDILDHTGKDVYGDDYLLSSTDTETVTAGSGAEVFNDYRETGFSSDTGWLSQGNIATGEYAHAEGSKNKAIGDCSHAEGSNSHAQGESSHAEGAYNVASGTGSHAEGWNVIANGAYSHGEGHSTRPGGANSHAEGRNTTANAQSSHAEGEDTVASKRYSHAEGFGTKAAGRSQHTEGEYNVVDDSGDFTVRGKYIHIAGNGADDENRSNAYTLDWDGNGCFAGDVYVNGTDKETGNKVATEGFVTEQIAAVGPGEAATIEIGTVITTEYDQPASVTNSGDQQNAVFDFNIPAGAPARINGRDTINIVAGDNVEIEQDGDTLTISSTGGSGSSSGGAADSIDCDGFVLTFGKSGADLTATITYDQGEATLDTVAYNGKTYREMFITSNVLPEGDFESGLDQLRVNAGEPTIVEEAYDSPGHGLKCFGASSQQLITTLSQAELGTHYIAVRVRLDRYSSGGGIGLQVPVGNDLATTEQTDGGFVTLSDLRTVGPTSVLYAGSIRSADLDGYIDDIVVVPTSVFGNLEKEEIDGLYEAYLKIRRGEPIPSAPPETLVLETRSTTPEAEHTDTECVARFMEAVSEKASALGMTSSTFTRPAGDGGNTTTARDLLRMLVEASGYKDITRIWGKDTRSIPVLGDNARAVTVNTTVTDPDLEGAYYVFGGKTGSWAGTENLAIVAETESHGIVAGVITNATSGAARFDAMKELLDVVDGDGTSVTSAVSAIACAVPSGNVFQYEGYPFPALYEQSADTETIPASVTKVLTAMVALDHTPDIHETIEFISSDAIGGSGAVFQTGDIITIEDALYAMLLPSSNMAAQAVARTVGRKLLEREDI